MAKVSKELLKELVKECLFEILLESTGDAGMNLMENKVPPKRRPKKNTNRSLRPALDNIAYGSDKRKNTTRSSTPLDVSSITSDPVMAAIFQDTAATTLKEQAAAERGRPVGNDAISQAVSDSDPTPLFGEAAQNWATLAFSEKAKR